MTSERPRPVVLCVIEGLGERASTDGNAVKLAKTPHLAALGSAAATTTLLASGPAIGLRPNDAGSGAAGALAIGAGRPVAGARQPVDRAIAERTLARNPVLDQTLRICSYDKCALHLVGLVSDGEQHASMQHLQELIDVAEFWEIPTVVHAILDGRDMGRRSAMALLDRLELFMHGKKARIGTLSGRHYAMDRDGRWDRVYEAFQVIARDKTLGRQSLQFDTPMEAISHAYAAGQNDDSLFPVRIGDYQGIKGDFACDFSAGKPLWGWHGEEAGFAFNFRGDRMQQLVAMLSRTGVPQEVADDLLMDRDKPVQAFREHCLATLTDYGLLLPIAFGSERLEDTLGQVLARAGLKQLRVVESEKQRNATHHFDGRGALPEGASVDIAPTPRLIERYDDKPALSADKVANRAEAAISGGGFDFVLVVLGHPDIVAHGGNLEATIAAVEAADGALGRIEAAVSAAGGVLAVTSTHGHCETMINEKGAPHSRHTDSPVPFLLRDPRGAIRLRDGGSLCDVAPTLLELVGAPQPTLMSGRSLLVRGDRSE